MCIQLKLSFPETPMQVTLALTTAALTPYLDLV